MTIDKRTLNLLGLLIVVAVFGLGTLFFAKPMLDGVLAANSAIADTEQTNQTYRTKLAELTAAEGKRAELEAALANLKREMPATAETASVLQVIEQALAAQGLQISSYSIGEPFDFVPRVDPNATDEAAQPAAPPADAPAPEAAAPPANEDAAPAEAAAPTTEPRKQFEVTLEVDVPDEATATAFLDALQAGPRLLLVTSANAQKASGEATGTLSVTLQVFYRTGA